MPKFEWVKFATEAAILINQPHEDYPDRVGSTWGVITGDLYRMAAGQQRGVLFTRLNIMKAHRAIFGDMGNAGKWRETNVVVGGLYRAPDYSMIEKYMEELFLHTRLVMSSVEEVVDWYTDFETIHPFEDGNGRVGGSIVAAVSHLLQPERGYLAPLQ